MLHRLDAQSRGQLQRFTGQVAFLALMSAPALLIDGRAPTLYVLQLRTMFSFSALVILVFATFFRQPWSKTSICIWDHFVAFMFLKSGCSVALWLLQ